MKFYKLGSEEVRTVRNRPKLTGRLGWGRQGSQGLPESLVFLGTESFERNM